MDPAVETLAKFAGQESETITINIFDEETGVDTAKEITIRKIRIKQFNAVFKKIDELVEKGTVKLTDETGAFIFSAKGIFTQFSEAKLFLQGGDPVLDIVAIVSGLTRAEVDNLDPVEFAKVLGTSWRVNERFFVRNQSELKEALGPIWTIAEGVINGLKKASQPIESIPDSSTNSSPTDTEPSSKS